MTTAYVGGATKSADARIRQAQPSQRNQIVFYEARSLYEIVAGGELNRSEADRVIREAAKSIKLPGAEVEALIRSAFKAGARNPRRHREDSPATLPPAEPLRYPNQDVVRAMIGMSGSVLADGQVCNYLTGRGIDPVRVSRGRLARSLCPGIDWPEEFSPPDTRIQDTLPRAIMDDPGYRLLFELVDCNGVARSLLVRRCSGDGRKNLNLKGMRSLLVVANSAGRALLMERKRPALWEDAPIQAVITEGEIDFLSAATEAVPEGTFRAVFGISSGSWGMRFANAIPQGAQIIVATDNDAAGDKYADLVARTLGGRSFFRWRPNTPGQDVTDAGGLAGGTLDECQQHG